MWEIIAGDDEDEDEIIPFSDMVPDDEDYSYRAKCIRLAQATGQSAFDLYENRCMSDVYAWDAIRIADDYRFNSKNH